MPLLCCVLKDELSLPRLFLYAALADGVVDTHAEIVVAAQGHTLFAELTNAVVRAEEEVETARMEVDNPTHVGT